MTKLFTWDEISNEINEMDYKTFYEMNIDGGWTEEGVLENRVVVRKTDRHFALDVQAEDANEAHAKFSEFPYYVECQED